MQFEVVNDYSDRFSSPGIWWFGVYEKIPMTMRTNADAIFVVWRPKIGTPHMHDIPFF